MSLLPKWCLLVEVTKTEDYVSQNTAVKMTKKKYNYLSCAKPNGLANG